MRRFKKDLILKYFKIIPLIIFIFSNSIALGATVTFVDKLAIKSTAEGEQTVPLGVEFNPDGTKMYMTGTSSNKVFQYTLTTAFDIATAVGSAPLADTCQLTFDHRAGSDADITNLKFNNDGTKFFVVDTHNDQGERIDVYTLSTAYDMSTCTYDSSLELPTLENRALDFSNDGKMLFVFDQTGNYSVKQYSMATAFDISNATLVKSYEGTNIEAIENNAHGMIFSANGLKMFTTGAAEQTVIQFSLSKPFDLRDKVTLDG